jgi:hypothetical protein
MVVMINPFQNNGIYSLPHNKTYEKNGGITQEWGLGWFFRVELNCDDATCL